MGILSFHVGVGRMEAHQQGLFTLLELAHLDAHALLLPRLG